MKIGRYEIESELGEGGMAAVYLASDPYIKRKVAVKVMSFELTGDTLAYSYFQREAEVIAALEHPYIVPIFDFGKQGNQLYIVMRHMTGGSLEDVFLKKEEIVYKDLSALFVRIGTALDAAHARDVIHRDIKPGNILFDDQRNAYLSDFGLAKWSERSTGQSSGFVVGTPEYMSPEQAQSKPLDARSDVYALGILLYELLVGSVPFSKDYPMATAVAHVNDPLPDILAINPDLHPAWGEIVNKALAKNPDDRYQSAGAMAKEVEQVAAGRWYWRKLENNLWKRLEAEKEDDSSED